LAKSGDERIFTFRDFLVKLINELNPELAGYFKTKAILTMFYNIYIICFEQLHEESAGQKV